MLKMFSRTWNFSVNFMQQKNPQDPKHMAKKCSKNECGDNVCRIGPRPTSCRDPPAGYSPCRLKTKAFKLPPFIKPKIFRKVEKKEKLGPGAHKCECYKNPEYYSYHRYSYYDLNSARNALKTCVKCCK